MDTHDPLVGMKASPRPLKGRCRVCKYQDVCGGNTRVCAFQLSGDPWWGIPSTTNLLLEFSRLKISPLDFPNR
jgi:hypothetical protein